MLRGGTVLVVDDDPILREIARELLVQRGFDVWLVEDGVLALQRLAIGQPDVVVMDMVMPNKDGIETIQEVKRRWPQVPVIAVSAGRGSMDANLLLRAARAIGADACMRKPLNPAKFIKLVEELASPGSAASTRTVVSSELSGPTVFSTLRRWR